MEETCYNRNMALSPGTPVDPIPAHVRSGISDLRQGLLRLHRTLIMAEQLTYERIYGRIESTGQLLQLVMKDPWFAWLHPLSNLVVRIDQMLEEETEASLAKAAVLLDEARALLQPSEIGDGFERSYYEALQRMPDVVLAHAQVKQLLRAVPSVA
ncbi:MAG: hypothetical protein NW701_05720 [Nitrospira sp.]